MGTLALPDSLILILLILWLSHWLGGIASFGSSSISMPILVWVMDIQAALYCLVMLGILQNLEVFRHTWREVDWRRLGEMVVIAGLCFPLGFWAMESLPDTLLLGNLGIITAASGLTRLRSSGQTPAIWPPWLLRALLALGGVIHGAFACGGATLVVYAQQVFTTKQTFRGTLSAAWVVLCLMLLVAILQWRPPSPSTQMTALAAIPVVALATWSANKYSMGLSRERFGRYVSWLLVICGASSILRALS